MYRREHATVFRMVYRLCGDRETAEDATQEAFARALARWRRLRGRPWAAGWVATTALNAARRAMRRRRADPSPPVTERDLDETADLWVAIGRLPRRQQEAVVLFYVTDLTLAGVAAAMGCAEGTAKAHLSRGRAALRVSLEGVRDE